MAQFDLTLQLKSEQYDATISGLSATYDSGTNFGTLLSFSPDPNAVGVPHGIWSVDNGDGTFDLFFSMQGVDNDTETLPVQGALVQLQVGVIGGDTVTVQGEDATYTTENQLGSTDDFDLSAIWHWADIPNSGGALLPFNDGLDIYDVTATLDDDPVVADDFNCDCDDETDNETLGELRTRMLVRLGYAAQAENPPPGMALLLDDFLIQAQRFLYRKYNAIRTERMFTWTMTQGQRFYDLPDNDETCEKELNPYRLTWVGVEDLNGAWYHLSQGIPPEWYTSVNFEGLPVRYEIRQCIEVFPAPSADGYKLRIKGDFGLTAFAEDDDKTTIDSELVFLWALANAKAHYGQPDAANYASQAREYLGTLVSGAHQTARYVPGTTPAQPWTPPVFLPLLGE